MNNLIGITLKTGNFKIDRAFRIAIGDMVGNVMYYQSGIMEEEAPCLVAGLSYPDPWTRDAAFNTWNGVGLLIPEVMKNTLLSCLTKGDATAGMGEGCHDEAGSQVPNGVISIAGQYWDRIIWTIGAWVYYCQNGDKEFLKTAFEAIKNSLPYLEENEFDEEMNLFRGGACIADGLGAYGDIYSNVEKSGIFQWPEKNSDLRHPQGAGLPLMAMSTNCLYAESYRLLSLMAEELGETEDPRWCEMCQKVISGIQKHLWDKENQLFKVYIDPWDSAGARQECLGNCFALLFGIANEEQRALIVKNQPHFDFGPPAVWPNYPRYEKANIPIQSCPEGREDIAAENLVLSEFCEIRKGLACHGGSVWPLIMGIYGDAVLKQKYPDLFDLEMDLMADIFSRAVQSPEIVHPDCGAPGGAVVEANGSPDSIQRTVSCYRQTWSATSYLRMILHGIFGIECLPDKLRFSPHLPEGMDSAELLGLPYREAILNIKIIKSNENTILLDGAEVLEIPGNLSGKHEVILKMQKLKNL